MIANRRRQVVVKTQVSRKVEPDPSVWLVSINTGLVILAFGAAWFVFLRGLTALGRMLMVWHFYI
jgi:hypothetical protein